MKVNFKIFEGQTSSEEDIYFLANYIDDPKTSKIGLKNLLKCYDDPKIVIEAKKLAKMGWKKAAHLARRSLQRKGEI